MNVNASTYDQVARVARDGSPLIMSAVGRLYGFSQDEVAAMRRGLPLWTVAVIAGAIGVWAGVRLDRAYGHKLPRWVTGGGRR